MASIEGVGVALPVELADTRGPPAAGNAIRFQVLGPLRVWRDGVELNAGPPQQAYLLALLLARAGRPTSTSELVDLVWGEGAPTSAVNVLHKYIGSLRRLLEPDLPPRGEGAHFLRRGNGYQFSVGSGRLDLIDFRESVTAADSARSTDRLTSALDRYVAALGQWAGPAGDGLAVGAEASAIFAGVNNELFDTCTAAAELAVSLGRPERVLAPLRLAAGMAPLHEPLHASLITVLGAAGRSADALAAYRAVRGRLADELGLDPGPALTAVHQRVLRRLSEESSSAPGVASIAGLVGRAEELAVLRQVTAPVFAGGSALVIIEGEPGVGKTRLLEEVVSEPDHPGALVVWGRCFQSDGTPSMWPWVQAVRTLVDALPDEMREAWLDSDLGRLLEPREGTPSGSVLPDSGGQFRLFERVVGVISELARHRPLILVIDDLHWADVASLQLFGHLAGRLPAGVALFGALRDSAPPPGTELSRMLAAASRAAGHRRIRLGPLDFTGVAELVRRETGRDPGPDTAQSIFMRTAGNPFFVRELSRFLAATGGLTSGTAEPVGVPTTVLDVVRDRLSGMDSQSELLVQAAALAGREVAIGLLADVADVDVRTCLERLEPLEGLGLLAPTPQNPHSVRFTHDLVRESVVGTTPSGRSTRLHLRIADAIERGEPDDESRAERLAYHLWSAGPLADPSRTACALIGAGSRATTKSALEAAEGHLRSAVRISREAGLAELELTALAQLTAVVGMREMYGTAALDLLERAERLARTLGRDLEATGFLFSRWTAHGQAVEFDRSGPLARILLEQGYASSDQTLRTYGIQAWGIHQYHMGNIGESIRYVSQSEATLLEGLVRRDQDPVRGDLELLMTGMLAEITAVHGDVPAARRLLDAIEAAAGENPYRVTVWATMVSRVAAVVGDPEWALRAATRGIAVDAGFSFVFLGTYQRLARCWALVVTGADPDSIGEAQRIIAANLLDPPRSCVSTWYALLGEMFLAAERIDDAAVALNRAGFYLNSFGQRSSEGLLGVLRARLAQARGEPTTVVRETAEAARALSAEREAGLFVQRADDLLAEIG